VGWWVESPVLQKSSVSDYLLVSFVAVLPLDEIGTMASLNMEMLEQYVGLAVFDISEKSVRLAGWSVSENGTFTGNHPEASEFELLPDGTVRFTLPDGRPLTAEVTLP
jgi:hypothetical protein